MTQILAVFRSRTEVFAFIENMKNQGAQVTTAATPSEAGIGCGISAKFALRYFNLARRIISSGSYGGFYACFKITSVGLKRSAERIL